MKKSNKSKKSATAEDIVVSTGSCFSLPRPSDDFKKAASDKAVAERERVRDAHKKSFALVLASIQKIKKKKLKR